jgi:hypothetical protein
MFAKTRNFLCLPGHPNEGDKSREFLCSEGEGHGREPVRKMGEVLIQHCTAATL